MGSGMEGHEMKRWFILTFVFLLLAQTAHALDVQTFSAQSIDASQGDATLYSHERILLGLSCKSGPVGKLPGLATISIGDKIIYKNYSLRVGIIEVSRFNQDATWAGSTIAKKGDIVCVVASSRETLPSEKDCNALWLRIVNCRPLR